MNHFSLTQFLQTQLIELVRTADNEREKYYLKYYYQIGIAIKMYLPLKNLFKMFIAEQFTYLDHRIYPI